MRQEKAFSGDVIAFRLALVATILLACVTGLAWYAWRLHRQVIAETKRIRLAAELCRNFSHAADMRAMAVHMAVASGDLRWEARHAACGTAMSSALRELALLAANSKAGPATDRLLAVKRNFAETHALALDLVRKGRPQAAMEILSSAQYEQQRRACARAAAEVLEAFSLPREPWLPPRSQALLLAVGLGIAITALALLLIVILRRMNKQVADLEWVHRALEESRESYDELAEVAQDTVFVIGRNMRVRFVNSFGAALFNRTRDELIGNRLCELFCPEVYPRMEANLNKVFESGLPLEVEDQFKFPVGEIWLHTRLVPARSRGGAITAVLGISRDITARRRLEEALAEQRKLFETTLQQAIDGIVVCDAHGRLTFANAAAWRVAHLDPLDTTLDCATAVRGKPYYPDGYEIPVSGALARALRGEPTIVRETHLVRPDGTQCYLLINAAPLRNRDGEIIGAVAIFSDITQRKAAEEAVRESRLTLSTLLSNLPGAAYRMRNDRSWTAKFLSEGCRSLTGYEPQDFIGNRTLAFADIIHPDDREPVWQGVQEALRQRAPYQLEYRIRTRAGEEKWVWEQGCGVFGPGGEVLALEGFITDITDRKRAEEGLRASEARFRGLFEQCPTPLTVNDFSAVREYVDSLRAGGVNDFGAYAQEHPEFILECLRRAMILEVNPAALRMMQADDEEQYRRDFRKAHVPESFDFSRKALLALCEGKTSFEGETVVKTFKGELRNVLVRVQVLPGSERTWQRVFRATVDLTALKRAEMEIAERKREAMLHRVESLSAIGQLAAGIAHEINNPLQGIKAQIRLLTDELPDHLRESSRIRTVLEELDRIKRIVMLVVSLHQEQTAAPTASSIGAVLSHLTELLACQLKRRMVKLTIDVSPPDLVVPMNADHLTQVMLNLILNACDAMPTGGDLRISACSIGDEVCVSVTDNGEGILPDICLKYSCRSSPPRAQRGPALGSRSATRSLRPQAVESRSKANRQKVQPWSYIFRLASWPRLPLRDRQETKRPRRRILRRGRYADQPGRIVTA